MNVGSLCTGIGALDLGLERAGMRVAWQCESDAFCRRVLARHWPSVPIFWDIKSLEEPARVDIIAAGFPCPVNSSAARGRNVGEWLWPEVARVIRVVRPTYVVVENVEGLLYRDRRFGEVLSDLAACGFDATWRVLRASDFGAPHHRARLWLVGYPHGESEPDLALHDEVARLPELRGAVRRWPDPPRGLGVADGLADRVDRCRVLGNSVVVPMAEHVGRAVMSAYTRTALESSAASSLRTAQVAPSVAPFGAPEAPSRGQNE